MDNLKKENMTKEKLLKFIEKEFKSHVGYTTKFEIANSAFSVEFYHPITKKRITYSEMLSLIDADAAKRAKKISKVFFENN